MIKINLTSFDAFIEALVSSVDAGVRDFILSRPESELQKMYQDALSQEKKMNRQRPGRGYIKIELCAPDPSADFPRWWEASLIWFEASAWVGLEPPGRQRFSAIHDGDTGVESVEKVQATISTRPPPKPPFIPLPKTEIGGYARSDSSAPAI